MTNWRCVVEVGGGDHGAAGTALRCAQERVDVERHPAQPSRERRRCEQAVQPHRQRRAGGGGHERIEVEDTELAERRCHHHPDQAREVEAAPGAPLVQDEVAEQDVLAAAQGVGVDAHQAEEAGHERLDLVGDGLGVVGIRRRVERADDVEAHAARGARGVDRDRRPSAQRRDVGGPQAPAGEAVAPARRLRRGELAPGGRRSRRRLDPRLELPRRQRGEGERQVGEVALRVDQQRRDPRAEHLLDQDDAEAGLARPGHPDDHPVRRQLRGGDGGRLGAPFARDRIDPRAQQQLSHGGAR